MEAAREAGELGAYTKAWAAQAARLGEAAPGSALLRRRLEAGMTPKTLELAVRLALCEVTPARPLPSLAAIERGLRQQTLPGATELLRQLSVVELLLLLALKKLGDREAPPPHTLRMVLREYNADFLASVERGQAARYEYPAPLLKKAFEHLCSLGLVECVREARRGTQPVDGLPLRLCIDAAEIHAFVQRSSEIPLQVQRWGSQWLH